MTEWRHCKIYTENSLKNKYFVVRYAKFDGIDLLVEVFIWEMRI